MLQIYLFQSIILSFIFFFYMPWVIYIRASNSASIISTLIFNVNEDWESISWGKHRRDTATSHIILTNLWWNAKRHDYSDGKRSSAEKQHHQPLLYPKWLPSDTHTLLTSFFLKINDKFFTLTHSLETSFCHIPYEIFHFLFLVNYLFKLK